MEQYYNLIFSCILSVLGTMIVLLFRGMRDDVKNMANSITSLNEKVGIILNDQKWHKEEIKELKDRLDKLDENQ